MIAYAGDVHIVGPPHVVSRALAALVSSTPPLDPALDCRLAPLGLELSPGKTSIFLGPEVSSQVFQAALQPIVDLIDARVCSAAALTRVATFNNRVLSTAKVTRFWGLPWVPPNLSTAL